MSTAKYHAVAPDDEEVAVVMDGSGNEKLLATTQPCERKKRFGGVGCIVKSIIKFLIILALAVAIVFAILGMVAYHFLGHHAMNYLGDIVIPQITTTHPEIPPYDPVHLSKSEIHDIEQRLRSFDKLMHHHHHHNKKGEDQDLVLTEREINGLLCHYEPDMCELVHVSIFDKNHTMEAAFSIPAEGLVDEKGRGRYFVGKKSFTVAPASKAVYSMQQTVTLRGGKDDSDFTMVNVTGTVDLSSTDMDVHVKSAELIGWMATDAFVKRFFDNMNLAEFMCPKAKKAVMDHIEGVSIGDGKKVVVHVKKNDFE